MDIALRAATYDIHNSVGRNGRFDLSRIAQVLVEMEAEVIALQEVTLDHAGEFSGMLEAATGLRAIDGSIFEREAGRYGSAVLTAHPIIVTRLHDLSVVGRERRGVIDIALDIGGASCRVCATHPGLTRNERRSQIDRLSARLSVDESAALLLGDFNIPWHSKAVAPFTAIGFRHIAVPSFPTWPSPVAALDRIFARPPADIRDCWRHDSPLARRASDHFPVLADLRIMHGRSC